MRGLLLLIVAGLVARCGCSDTGLMGSPDFGTDPGFESTRDIDVDPSTDPVDTSTDPGFEPTACDRDGDGWDSPECGGTDCNDDDPLIHPGAREICEDGIDQDCDGWDATEGLRGENLVLLDYIHEGPNLWTKLVWTGRDYSFLWRIFMGEATFLDHIDPGGKGVVEEVAIREYQSCYDMVWSGSGYGTAWSMGTEGNKNLYFQLLDADGRPVMEEVQLTHSGEVAINGSTYYGPKMLSVDDDFIILFLDQRTGDRRLYFVRVASDGTPLTDEVEIAVHIPELDGGLTATWTGSEAGIVWNAVAYEPPMLGQFHFSRVDIDGSHLREPYELSVTAEYHQEPPVLWTGSEYGIFLKEKNPETSGYEVVLLRRAADGSEIARVKPFPTVRELHLNGPQAVWTGTSYVLFWMEYTPEDSGSYVQRVSSEGELLEPKIAVSSMGSDELNIVWSGAELGISWVERTETEEGQRVRALFNRIGFCE